MFCWQLLNGLFVLRTSLKGLIGLCEEEDQIETHFDGIKRIENLTKAVSGNIIDLDEKYVMHILTYVYLLKYYLATSERIFQNGCEKRLLKQIIFDERAIIIECD